LFWFVFAECVSRFGLIALLYLLVNNMKLYAQLHLDPGTFTLLNNLSIPFAAILFRIVMKRKLTSYQVCALVILVTGLVTSKLTIVMGGTHHQHLHDAIAEAKARAVASSFASGLAVMVIASLCAAVGDVGAEFAFKEWQHKQHFVAQSLSLYAFGVALNLAAIVAANWSELAEEYARILDLGTGWIIVWSNAVNGILIGLVFRYSVGGNINKIFADAGGLLLTLTLAAVVLGQVPQLDVWCGLVSIYTGIYIYSSQSHECEKLNAKTDTE
jgi:drug/metabolite transporter (DMT)-like permease